jgi:hypothetical protein
VIIFTAGNDLYIGLFRCKAAGAATRWMIKLLTESLPRRLSLFYRVSCAALAYDTEQGDLR